MSMVWLRFFGFPILVIAAAGCVGTPHMVAPGPSSPSVNVASTVPVQQAGIPYSFDKVATCNNFNCVSDFPTVPAGKILVITYMSAVGRPKLSTTIFDFVELLASNTIDTSVATRYTFPMQRIGQAGDSVIADTWGANSQLVAFVLAGQAPRITMTQRNQGETFFAQSTIAGYLLNASQ